MVFAFLVFVVVIGVVASIGLGLGYLAWRLHWPWRVLPLVALVWCVWALGYYVFGWWEPFIRAANEQRVNAFDAQLRVGETRRDLESGFASTTPRPTYIFDTNFAKEGWIAYVFAFKGNYCANEAYAIVVTFRNGKVTSWRRDGGFAGGSSCAP